jgi:hypothetical protein
MKPLSRVRPPFPFEVEVPMSLLPPLREGSTLDSLPTLLSGIWVTTMYVVLGDYDGGQTYVWEQALWTFFIRLLYHSSHLCWICSL